MRSNSFIKLWRNLRSTPDLVARTIMILMASIFLVVATHAQPPNPAIPVGSLSAYPSIIETHPRAKLEWSILLPDTANPEDYHHFIRQVQTTYSVIYDTPVNIVGESWSSIPVDRNASKFELWTIHKSTSNARLLATTTVSTYAPRARVTIRSEDPYSALPRTRADRPFFVDVAVDGIRNGEEEPEVSRGVSLIRQAGSYGATGTGAGADSLYAPLISEEPITTNGTRTWAITVHSIPTPNGTKTRGEERFSVFTREDYQFPSSILDSKFIQIWPVADAAIQGLNQGQIIGAIVPEVTLTLNDLYPSSSTWAQVYQGVPQNGVTATILPGSHLVLNSPTPVSRVLKAGNYGSIFNSDGVWTMEILTQTPFGTERLAHTSFSVESLGNSLESWRQTHFGSPEDSGVGANLEDFDKDGLGNLVEFAFGFDPTKNSSGQLPTPQQIGNNTVISFTRPAGVSGIAYGAEWSTTLLPDGWSPIPDTGVFPKHSFTVPMGTYPNFYLRLKVMVP